MPMSEKATMGSLPRMRPQNKGVVLARQDDLIPDITWKGRVEDVGGEVLVIRVAGLRWDKT